MEKKKLNLKDIGIRKLLIICVAGIFLIVVSIPDIMSVTKGGKTENKTVNTAAAPNGQNKEASDSYTGKMEKKLKAVLKKVEGIGDVEVMITLKSSKEQITLKDTPYSQDSSNETDGSGGSRISNKIEKGDETVLVKSDQGDSVPYVVKELEPEIEGVVVIAQGGGSPVIISEINSAIEVLFGVPVHKIKVMKMVD